MGARADVMLAHGLIDTEFWSIFPDTADSQIEFRVVHMRPLTMELTQAGRLVGALSAVNETEVAEKISRAIETARHYVARRAGRASLLDASQQ